jgi:hypothetical protein
MNTITNEIQNQTFDFDLLAPSAQAAIRLAQLEATRMNAPKVYPEHLFLGILAQADVEIAKVLNCLGFRLQEIQTQAAETFGKLNYEGEEEKKYPFSSESLACFEWALSFSTQMNSSLIFPKHLFLSVLRHPRIQPLLVLLLPSQDALPAPMMEVDGLAYTIYIDQLIHSRVREQSVVGYTTVSPKRVLTRFDRPGITFADIKGLEGAKRDLREVVEFLRKQLIFQHSIRTYLYGVLVVSHPSTDRTLLVEATAGEAVVPLVYLSISTLVGLLNDLNSDVLSIEDLDFPMDEYNLLKNSEPSKRGRNMLEHIFSQAKKSSPCILFIDNLDGVEQLSTNQEREQWLQQLVVEMDRLDDHPSMVVIATTSHTDGLGQALLHPGRFDRKIEIGSSFMARPAAQVKLCLSCQYEVLAHWKYCVYCGARLVHNCPNCGTPFLQIEEARFCFECGTPWGSFE